MCNVPWNVNAVGHVDAGWTGEHLELVVTQVKVTQTRGRPQFLWYFLNVVVRCTEPEQAGKVEDVWVNVCEEVMREI